MEIHLKKLTDQQIAHGEKIEKNTATVEEAIKETPDHQFVGELAINRHGGVTVPTSHLTYQANDLRSRRDRGDKVTPVYIQIHDDGDFSWILNDVDAEACVQGYICESCLEWQKSTLTPKCEWLHREGSCGYTKEIY